MVSLEQASLNGQLPLELRLSHELQAAYEQQLIEQEQSTRRFFNKIAALCEREECSGLAIANALNELGNAESACSRSLRRDVAVVKETCVKETRREVVVVKETCFEERHAALVPDPSVGSPAELETGMSVAGIIVNADEETNRQEMLASFKASDTEASQQKTRKSRTSVSQAFQDVGDKDMEVMRHEFEIPRCAFIEANGKIVHRPSDFELICGPGLRHFYERLTARWLQPMEGRFLHFVQGTPFKTVGTLVILANFFFIIIQSDYRIWAELNGFASKEADWMKLAEVFFTLYYVFEVTCLITAYRKDFFFGDEMSWNWFDFIIVLTGAAELLMTSLGGSMANLSFLRVLRFFKMTRVLRMFSALRMVKDVKVMVDALTGSFMIFFFGCMLLAMMLSVFSIFFVQGMSTFLEGNTNVDAELRANIFLDWGSVATAMRSLFMSATGGDDWSKFHSTLKAIGPAYDYLYLFFIAFTLSAFFNVITGVFAEKAMSLAAPTMEEKSARRLESEVKDAQELVNLLDHVLQADGSGTIGLDAFEDLMSHPQVIAFFEVRGLKATTAHRFFMQLLDINGTDRMGVGAFVSACVKLDGTASSIDLHVLSVEVQTLLVQQHMLHSTLKNNFDAVAKQLALYHDFASKPPLATPPVADTSLKMCHDAASEPPLAVPPVVDMSLETTTSALTPSTVAAPMRIEVSMEDPVFSATQGNMQERVDSTAAKAVDECADSILMRSCCNGMKPSDAKSLPSTNPGSGSFQSAHVADNVTSWQL